MFCGILNVKLVLKIYYPKLYIKPLPINHILKAYNNKTKKIMKNLAKTLALSATLVLGLTISSSAQTADKLIENGKKGGNRELNLTEDQKAQIKANHENIKAHQEKFNASLNAEQKAIMDDKALKPKEKMQKLKGTLSDEQKAMFKAKMEHSKKNREAFRSKLSPDQKEKKGIRKAEKGKGERKGKGGNKAG